MSKDVIRAVGYWSGGEMTGCPDPKEMPVRVYDPEEKARIVSYLKSGAEYQGWMGFSYCRFDCGVCCSKMGTKDFTDGTWFWPEGFYHYIETHDLELPGAFLKTMEENGWEVPVEDLPPF